MRTLLTSFLLTVAVLPALSQAQTVNICDRTPQVRDEILLALELEADDCAAVTAEQLAAIDRLCFHDLLDSTYCRSSYDRDPLATLKPSDFDGLTGLQFLSLFNNELTSLPAGVFDGLTGLQDLSLGSNNLASLPDGIFDGLTGLQDLSLGSNNLASLPDGIFDGLTELVNLDLQGNLLVGLTENDPLFAGLSADLQLGGQTEPVNVCERTPQVRDAIMEASGAVDCAAVNSTRVTFLNLFGKQLTALQASDFDGLTGLQFLSLFNNELTSLPAGVFDGLESLQQLSLLNNELTSLPAGVFDGLTSLQTLFLNNNNLASLPDGIFDGLTGLQGLYLFNNELTSLPAGAFDGLESLQQLWLFNNQLTSLPAGVFDGLTGLQRLILAGIRLTSLPAGVFDGLTGLRELNLYNNKLTTLPAGLFDGLESLQLLYLAENKLTTLPAGIFDGLTGLQTLHLQDNHLVGLSRTDASLAGVSSSVQVRLGGQTEAGRLAAAVPLLVSASDSTRQGFVRIINESDESGSVRILAYDDAGTAANPVEIQLGANQAYHFNAGDLENGNADKGINEGVGSPTQGDWRLDIETALSVRVLSYIRTNDGFLTAMHDELPRVFINGAADVRFFNPASNTSSVSRLRLVNTGGNAESVSIEGVDDQGASAGPVSLTLAAGESRTLSAQDLESGAQGLTGTLGDGAGKWQLVVGVGDTGDSVVGMSLLDSASGHLSNLSTITFNNQIPLFVSASDSMRQSFVRIINKSGEESSGGVRITAYDDAGTAAEPIEIQLQLGANQAYHFNAGDLENGNADKGINEGVGSPTQGDWRLGVSPDWRLELLYYVRTGDGFLTAMHDVLPRDAQDRLAVHFFNPASNTSRVSRLRLANTGGNAESVSIEGVDDQGASAGPVSLTLAAGESRTLSAQDLESGAQGLIGTLGDGAGKWRLFVTAVDSVVGMSLLDSASGHLSNLSTGGVAEED